VTNQEELLEDAEYEEFLSYAAAIVVAYKHGCRCGTCWDKCLSWRSCDGSSIIERGDPPCLSAVGAEAVSDAWGAGEAIAIARRRRDRAPPFIDGNQTHRFLNKPKIWKTVEAVTRILRDGAEEEGEEPEEVARLLKARLFPLDAGRN
jgi:hypothetical protein